jgi:hypothetical protein
VGIYEDHLVRLNTPWRPIVNQYREGKVKRTPARGVKEYLKPYAYKQWEGYARILRVTGMPDRVPFA